METGAADMETKATLRNDDSHVIINLPVAELPGRQGLWQKAILPSGRLGHGRLSFY